MPRQVLKPYDVRRKKGRPRIPGLTRTEKLDLQLSIEQADEEWFKTRYPEAHAYVTRDGANPWTPVAVEPAPQSPPKSTRKFKKRPKWKVDLDTPQEGIKATTSEGIRKAIGAKSLAKHPDVYALMEHWILNGRTKEALLNAPWPEVPVERRRAIAREYGLELSLRYLVDECWWEGQKDAAKPKVTAERVGCNSELLDPETFARVT